MTKRIYVLNGHPADTSLNRVLAVSYVEGATDMGLEVRLTHLHDLDFDSDWGRSGYGDPKPLETVLEQVIADIEWAEHFVLITPMWWGGLPAKLKGLFDRILLPGRAFDTRNPGLLFPAPMLKGRTARVILTSDTPNWFLGLVYRNALPRQIRDQILGFVGIKPTKFTHLAGASKATSGVVDRWITRVTKLGAAAA